MLDCLAHHVFLSGVRECWYIAVVRIVVVCTTCVVGIGSYDLVYVDEYECWMNMLVCVPQPCVSLFGGCCDHECYGVSMMSWVVLFGHLV